MRKIFLAAALALTLSACATSNDAYYKAVAEREQRIAEQELRADTAIAQMAASGDPQAKGMGLMYFALKANGAKANQQTIAAPKSVAEQLLPWASLVVPSLTQLYGIHQQTRVQINSSDNALEGKLADNDMITDLVHGRIPPIVGDADDVLIYPFK
jgi:hypothetical protein